MRKSLLLLTAILSFTFSIKAQDCNDIQFDIETFAVHTGMVGSVDLTGFTTYRVYLTVPNDDDFVSLMAGLDPTPLIFSFSDSLWQSPLGGVTADDVNDSFYPTFPSLEYDSYVTIGKTNVNDPGGSLSTAVDSNNPWTDNFEAGEDLIIDGPIGGLWYQLNIPGATNAISGPDLKVLIGQFTTNGEFCLLGTTQIFPHGVSGDSAYECFSVSSGTNGCTDPIACNYDSTVDCDNGGCIYPDGCMDSTACNYNSESLCDDGSCCYDSCGCTDPTASNFDSSAFCENLSCEYNVSGSVFYDENENGIMDNGEYPLPLQEIALEPSNIVSLTNDNGTFYFQGLSLGGYSLSINTSESFPFITSDYPIDFNVITGGADQDLTIGVSDEVPNFSIEVTAYFGNYGALCDDYEVFSIFYRNMGNVPIDGVVELEYDPLFQGYEEMSPIDSVVDNHIYLSFNNLSPGELNYKYINLHTPTVDYMGEFLTSTSRVYGFYEDEQVAYGEATQVHELTCSYDPNDKQVFPEGYEEAHYILNDTELEYLVRFQNTGNATATNVIVSDTIDDNLDLSTFSLMANSHSVTSNINSDTRVIDFIFNNIMLPDSTTDEPGSHGLISYKIRPLENLDLETEINNTAYIYFDNNPAIITNTTWSTIYSCDDYLPTITQIGTILTASQGLNYQWYINGEAIDGATNQIFEATENGNYSVEVTNTINCNNTSNEMFVDGIQEFGSEIISLYPNPMTEVSYLFFEEDCNNCTVLLHSSNGQLIREYSTITGNKLTIERKGLAAGTYVLQVISGAERVKEFVLVIE